MSNQTPSHTFQVATDAQRLYLADRQENGSCRMVRMIQTQPGFWEAIVPMPPGLHKLRYYAGGERAVVYAGPAPTAGAVCDGWDAILQVTEARDESPHPQSARPHRLFAADCAQPARPNSTLQ